MCLIVCCECFPPCDVVGDVFEDCRWDVCLCEFVDEFVNVDCVESFAHVKGYNDGA